MAFSLRKGFFVAISQSFRYLWGVQPKNLTIMRRFFFPILLAVVSCLTALAVSPYDVVPRPHSVVESKGEFKITPKTTIACDHSDATLLTQANLLADYIFELTGIRPAIAKKATSGSIVLATDAKLKITPASQPKCSLPGKEGFKLKVTGSKVTLTGESHGGVAMGMQLMRKALIATGNKSLPCATVTDYPDMPFRGFLLDVGRHFFTVDEVKRTIDMAALHQLNVFHWHLTEDQGWRIEIKQFPKLTEVGAWREGSLTEPGGKSDGIRHGGFYTQDQVRDIVQYAADRQITVIPEIDMPGHMMSALAAYPNLGCSKGPYDVQIKYGVLNDVLCVGGGESIDFAKKVLDEVLPLFPATYVHIGGDECPRVRWENCVHCQRLIEKMGWTDTPDHQKEAMLQSYFMQEIETYLNSHGKRMIGWDEMLDGKVADDATVMAWTEKAAAPRAAKLMHDVVVTPIQVNYLSNRWVAKQGLEWNLKNIYSFEYIDPSLTPEQAAHVIGLQGCLWTEWISTMQRIEYMVMPRLAAISERAWNRNATGGYDGFITRLRALTPMYKLLGYNYWNESPL